MKLDKKLSEKKGIAEYQVRNKYKLEFYATLFFNFVFTIYILFEGQNMIDYSSNFVEYFNPDILRNETDNNSQLYNFVRVSNYVFSFVLICLLVHFFILFSIRKNYEFSILNFLALSMAIYLPNVMAMISRRPPLNMLYQELRGTTCICKYSNPNQQVTFAVTLVMLIYFDHKTNDKWFEKIELLGKIFSYLLVIGVAFSELTQGISSITNVIAGILLGLLIFFTSRKFEDDINSILIWPIFYKDRFKNKPAIFTLLSLLMGLNYLSFFIYGLNVTLFELDNNMIKNIQNCFHCTDDEYLSYNFSAIHFKESLLFNIGIGGLLGIYLSKKKIFTYNGLLGDDNYKKFVFRILIYSLFFIPIIVMMNFSGNGVLFIILNFFVPILIGILIHTYFFNLLKILNLEIENDEEFQMDNLEALKEESEQTEESQVTEGDIDFDQLNQKNLLIIQCEFVVQTNQNNLKLNL